MVLLPRSSLKPLSRKTGDSGESGKEDGQVVDDRDTTLPLLLSPVSLISQWSDTDELVEPAAQREKSLRATAHTCRRTAVQINAHYFIFEPTYRFLIQVITTALIKHKPPSV